MRCRKTEKGERTKQKALSNSQKRIIRMVGKMFRNPTHQMSKLTLDQEYRKKKTVKYYFEKQKKKREIYKYKNYLVSLNDNKAMKQMSNTDLFNIRDNILGDLNQFLYLLTFN